MECSHCGGKMVKDKEGFDIDKLNKIVTGTLKEKRVNGIEYCE